MDKNTSVYNIDIEIANLTGVTLDVVKLILNAQELAILNKILEIQLAEDEIEYCEMGIFAVTDATDYKTISLAASPTLKHKITEVMKSGRDFLAESVIANFNAELIRKYHESHATDVVFEHDPVIDGDIDE